MRDVGVGSVSEDRHMLILIHLDHGEPPSGTVALPRDPERLSDDGCVMEFTGWLGMLHALQEALRLRDQAEL